MPTYTVTMVDDNGKPVLDLADTPKLLPGDELEWMSGKLDVTIVFDRSDIFKDFTDTVLKMPSDVPSVRFTVLDTAPESVPESYEATDNGSQQLFRRQGQPAAHPVMIFGP